MKEAAMADRKRKELPAAPAAQTVEEAWVQAERELNEAEKKLLAQLRDTKRRSPAGSAREGSA